MKKPTLDLDIIENATTQMELKLYDHIINLYGYIDYIEAKNTNMPSQQEFIDFWQANGYDPSLAVEPYLSYAENGWKDSNNKPIKNWKTKCRQVWFKPQNKIKDNQKLIGKPSVLSANKRIFEDDKKE